MDLDLDTARAAFEHSTDFTVGLEEEFALLDPRRPRARPALRGAARRGRRPIRCSPQSIAGELISSEIEIRSGRGEDLAAAIAAQRDRRRRLFALADRAGARARRDRHPSVVGLPRAADHRHRALPPRRGRAQVRRVAQQHVLAARPRRDPGRRPGGARCATACGRCCRCCSRSRRTRRSSTGATRGCTARARRSSRKSFPRCGIPDAFGSWDAFADYIDFLVRTRSIVEYTQVWWSVRPHFSFGTVEVRICDAQATAPESEALAALIVACVAQAARDIDAGVPFDDLPGRLIEENMWRAIRYGLDGELLDLDARRGVPGRRGGRAAARVDGARCAPSSGSRSRCPQLNGAQRQRRMLERGRRPAPRSTRRSVAETRETYAGALEHCGGDAMSTGSEQPAADRRGAARRLRGGDQADPRRAGAARARRDARQPRDAPHRARAGHRGRARSRAGAARDRGDPGAAAAARAGRARAGRRRSATRCRSCSSRS